LLRPRIKLRNINIIKNRINSRLVAAELTINTTPGKTHLPSSTTRSNTPAAGRAVDDTAKVKIEALRRNINSISTPNRVTVGPHIATVITSNTNSNKDSRSIHESVQLLTPSLTIRNPRSGRDFRNASNIITIRRTIVLATE